MNIGLKCFATLAEADKCDYKGSTSKTLPDGSTVRKLLIQEAIQVPIEPPRTTFVTDRYQPADHRTREGSTDWPVIHE